MRGIKLGFYTYAVIYDVDKRHDAIAGLGLLCSSSSSLSDAKIDGGIWVFTGS